ncbi:LysE family translocator [Undibacterium parvum]|uniref:LysE family translocator n=2 Tax=Undibacterium TaxID=401469 RepID=A0A6M4A432_9BURK|nr:LysE family translocator [Undibacterium parvum]AZP11480.1 LysE family translocator [Undibacterium parvum]MCX7217923.1 LysE family translocator [Burkholderiales bacterium]QJQ05945.1 LysE family translocator [Undibacterium piscinae]
MTELLPLMTYCFVMSGTPGPNNVMLASSGANFGYRGALPAILGIQFGVFVQTLVVCIGLGNVFIAYPQIQQVLRIAGALYLVYLAWKLSGASVGEAHAPTPVSFAQAALFQALNPKTWVKSITIASVFMPLGLSASSAALLVAVVGTLVGFPCSSMWALFGVAIRGLLRDPRKQRVFNLTMGATLLMLAGLFLR